MGAETKIQWTDFTFNGWIGCTKVSPGCQHCYAEVAYVTKTKGIKWGKGAQRYRTSENYWKDPLKWNRVFACGKCPVCGAAGNRTGTPCECGWALGFDRPRVFCASLSDWLDDEVPIGWLADLLKLIHDTPHLDWLLLTKRPQNWRLRIAQVITAFDDTTDAIVQGKGKPWLKMAKDWYHGTAPQNVWIGTTVEDQQRADERIPHLLNIPARIRFLSVEPMLGEIDFHRAMPCGYYCSEDVGHVDHQTLNGIHWAIFGLESGSKARIGNIDWMRQGVKQCRPAGVKVFVKQLGAHPFEESVYTPSDATVPEQVTQWLHLKDKKGGDITEFPEDLRIREFPV